MSAADAATPQARALALSRALPELILKARQVAASVVQGVHGRRRPGAGDAFWQYRPLMSGDSSSLIDWRRSARSMQMLVRQREWQAAQKVWLWIDRSASMQFSSGAEILSKSDCALVMGLALADMLVRGGERVGLIGLSRALASRSVIAQFAEILIHAPRVRMPPAQPLDGRAQAVWISDFLAPLPEIETQLRIMSQSGAKGVLLLIADAQEVLFPFAGHIEFMAQEEAGRAARAPVHTLRFGRAELTREAYLARRTAHIEGLGALARRCGWTLTQHRTDRPMAASLLGLGLSLGLQP